MPVRRHQVADLGHIRPSLIPGRIGEWRPAERGIGGVVAYTAIAAVADMMRIEPLENISSEPQTAMVSPLNEFANL
jgi:hypothetical protein